MSINLNKGPKTTDGAPITATTFEDTFGLAPGWAGYKYTATAGATNIYDEEVTVEKRLRGGWYEIMDSNAEVGDYVEFSVVDKDDVLGLFTLLGLEVGVDVLELRKYVKKDYVNPLAAGTRQAFVGNSAFLVVEGLYLRSTYVSTGSTAVVFKANTLAYE
jgi:hypothetical protein